MNVLICIDAFYDGGAEMFAIRLANNLPSGANVHFLALRPWLTKNNKQKKLLNRERVSVIECTGRFWGDVLFNLLHTISYIPLFKKMGSLAMDQRLLRICKRYSIQIVNSHSWASDHAFAGVRENGNFKLVSTFHGHYELFEGSWFGFEEDCRKILKYADAVVYLSPKHLATLDKYTVPNSKRIRIFNGLPFGLEKHATTYDGHEKLKLVLAARGIAEKGWEETIEAVISVHAELGDIITLDLIGTGEALEKLERKYGAYSYVSFRGYCDDVLPYVRKAHIGLLPSYYIAESLPNSISEYLMCGKPVIASDIGAIPEMMTSKGRVAGIILSTQGNKVSVIQIVNALKQYIHHPQKVGQDSLIALEAAKKFEMSTCTAQYMNLYNKLHSNVG